MIDQGTNICILSGKLETVEKDIRHGFRGLFYQINNTNLREMGTALYFLWSTIMLLVMI